MEGHGDDRAAGGVPQGLAWPERRPRFGGLRECFCFVPGVCSPPLLALADAATGREGYRE